jgi:lysophospholipase L1-like esterase
VAVSFGAPAVTGGVAPVSVSCTPPSGSTFSEGTTGVSCTATDAQQRTASCSLTVTVTSPPLPPPPPVPTLTATKFLAFGDSITEGKAGTCIRRFTSGTLTFVYDPFAMLAPLVPPGRNYPTMLQMMLATRYISQTASVLNEGFSGDLVTGSDTRARLNSALGLHQPEVLLLQEGVNDLHSQVAISALVSGLRTLIGDARARGVKVYLGTLLPERAGSCRAFAPDLIAPTNAQITAMAAAEGVPIVDLYQAFSGDLATLLDEDGLHPSDAGYEKMAATFFDSIKRDFEVYQLTHSDLSGHHLAAFR